MSRVVGGPTVFEVIRVDYGLAAFECPEGVSRPSFIRLRLPSRSVRSANDCQSIADADCRSVNVA